MVYCQTSEKLRNYRNSCEPFIKNLVLQEMYLTLTEVAYLPICGLLKIKKVHIL